MASTTTPFTLLDDMFATIGSQSTQRAAVANSAISSGLNFYQKKDYTRASAEFKRSIALDPTNTQAYNYLANSYLAQKKPEEAIKVYKNSLTLDPTQDSVHTNLGNIYLQDKKYNQAETEFKTATRLNPTDPLAPYTLGQLYLQTKRFPEAEAQFKKVQKISPSDANPLYSLGVTYNKEGKYADAVKQLTQAIKLKPKMAPAHLELGVAYAALGDTVNAQKEVDTLTRLDATQGALLKATIAQPKMVTVGGGDTDNFNYGLTNAMVPLFELDPSLGSANTSKEFRLTFYFDSKMDPASIQDTSNWTMTKASGGAAGYYNNLQPILPTEAYIPQNPTSVAYDPQNQAATVTFLISQNSTADATLDPSRIVFKFSGKDVTGKAMDPTSDQFDGFAQTPF
jgi:tetratricopeptide (TPR) repeat protein